MIEAILFKIIYLLLFGLVVETIIVFALVILVINRNEKDILNIDYVFVIILGILIMLKYKKLERMS